MKKLHLICNAHLDPIWQWDWEEGAAAAIATYKSAVDLAHEYDYIFCHNEVTLYKYIENYAPKLFEEIQKLVQAGKWHIMGGWYLQPDCNLPCGESIVRQIQVGKRYFIDKFGTYPKSAMNVDSFGHSIGIVQIIKKCGQDNYLMVRPQPWLLKLEDNDFIWKGLDGSTLKCFRAGAYNSPLGGARVRTENFIKVHENDENTMLLWGVGNHGGGPSRKDLADLAELIESSEVEIVHSTPDAYFAEKNPTYVFDKSLYISMPGCYTSSMRLKQKHIELEQQILFTEKLMSAAAMSGMVEYDSENMSKAVEDLLVSEFHDVLPGTSVQRGETNGLEYLNHGLRIVNELRAKAYFAMSLNLPRAKEGEYPVLVFNPHPYEITTNVEVEFSLADQNWSDQWKKLYVTDGENRLPSQIIKEESNLNLDWRKKMVFTATLKPLSISRFSIFETADELISDKLELGEGNIIVNEGGKYVEIDRKTGLLVSYKVDGKEYLDGKAFELCFYKDCADPWAMRSEAKDGWHENPEPFVLDDAPDGVFKNMESIQVIENGAIYIAVECYFKRGNTRARVEYRIYRGSSALDVNVTLFMCDIDKMLKLRVPVKDTVELLGQCPYGTDHLFTDGRENVSQRFIASKDSDGDCLAIINNCTYGSSFSFGNTIELSLVRGAGYCVHPINERPLIPEGRYIKRMDQGEMSYSFRLVAARENELERLASEFCQKPYAQSIFPTALEEEKPVVKIEVENPDIVVHTIKKGETVNAFVARLSNNAPTSASTVFRVGDKSIALDFGAYEVKTVLIGETLSLADEMVI